MKRLWREITDRLVLSIFFLALCIMAIIYPHHAIKTVQDFLAD